MKREKVNMLNMKRNNFIFSLLVIMYNTEFQSEKIIRLLTEKERKPRKKKEEQIFFVKNKKKKSKRK